MPPMNDTKHVVKEIVLFIFWAALFIFVFRTFIAKPFIVSGQSMEPTFSGGQYLFVDVLSYWLRAPERGEVVVLHPPFELSSNFIKRIVGLPGETINFQNGIVSITKNGQTKILVESYLSDDAKTAPGNYTVTLGPDEYFVMGDNRRNSSDSRVFGPVPRVDLEGRAFLRLFPPTKISYLPGYASIVTTN